MALYVAGQRIRASELNRLAQTYYVPAHFIKNNSSTLSNLTGMSFAVDATSGYVVTGHLAYHATEAGDIKLGWTFPGTPTGWWGISGIQAVVASPTGSGDAWRPVYDTITASSSPISGDDAVPMNVSFYAYFETTTAGTIQLQFAQNAAAVHDTFIRKGSFMTVTKVT